MQGVEHIQATDGEEHNGAPGAEKREMIIQLERIMTGPPTHLVLSCEAMRAGSRLRKRSRFLACLESSTGSGSAWSSISMWWDILLVILRTYVWAGTGLSGCECCDMDMTKRSEALLEWMDG
ncbi:hypothetical protein M5D96_003716 [Drosophila gunungcola]|uniref:Uncharacterized protein n=1 Tax=Drosophila gunungcola TaxID=103775 RepID=A0A9P9YT55_9MUSC|nr:hypothetical protein M5D96_003716 [Drosophila gunungcola]